MAPRRQRDHRVAESQPAFVRGLFGGAIHDEILFPYAVPLDTRDPGEARVVSRLLRELRRIQGDLIDSAAFDAAETIPEAVITAFADTGLLALTIPREYGGLGLSSTGYARVFSAISAADASLAVLVGVHCGLGSKAIALFGSAEQKSRYLPLLARGDTLAAYALTEPETGSDAQNIQTQATRSADGTHWILSGRKLWIGNGQRAGVIATFAQTAVERHGERVTRPTAFIVRPDMPGFRVVGTVRKMGIRGSTQAELAYENLQVPDDHVLGEVGKGFSVAVHVLNAGRLTLAAGCASGCKQFIGEMARYASQRVQFSHPLADFEITQRKLAEAAADAYAADAMVGALSAQADRCETDWSVEAACAKVFASEALWRIADDMVQLAGGRGYVQPYPFERHLRNSRINRIFEGANEVLRLFIALNGIQGPAARLKEVSAALRRPLSNFGVVSGYMTSRVTSLLGATPHIEYGLHASLAEHKRYFESHVAELAVEADRAITKHRRAITDRQLVLERLANMAIELYSTAAVIARTQRLIEVQGVEGSERERALCDLFCVMAGRRFRIQRQALAGREDPVDDTRRTIAAAVRAAAGYYVDDPVLQDGGQ
jgi:alkylation response protein AidB-like acyl-CoA dehydrogenase